MSYDYFLEHIDEYVGHVVEFTSRFKADGKTFSTQRYVWDRNEFGKPPADSLLEILFVKDVGEKKTVSLPGITMVV